MLLAAIFAGIEAHPAGYNPDPNYVDPVSGIHGGEPIVTALPVAGTTFVAGMNAFLNIRYVSRQRKPDIQEYAKPTF